MALVEFTVTPNLANKWEADIDFVDEPILVGSTRAIMDGVRERLARMWMVYKSLWYRRMMIDLMVVLWILLQLWATQTHPFFTMPRTAILLCVPAAMLLGWILYLYCGVESLTLTVMPFHLVLSCAACMSWVAVMCPSISS